MTQIRTECWALQCDECKRTFFHGRRRPPLRPAPDGWHISKGVPIRDLCPGCNETQEPAHAFAPCDRPDCPICATRSPLQTAHNESREGC